MQLLKTMFCAAAFATAMVGCKNVDFKKTKSGLAYKLFPSSSGAKAVAGGYLKVNLISKLRDSVLSNTYGSAPTYLQVPKAGEPARPYDITEITPLLKKGDSVYLVQSIDSIFKDAPPERIPPFFKKGDKIYVGLKVLDVIPTEEAAQADYQKEMAKAAEGQSAKDEKLIADYLSKNNIKAQKLPGGTYLEMLSSGNGEKIETGKFVSVLYKGKTFAGKVFDTNMDASFNHPQPMDMVLGSQPLAKGFEEGLKALKQGDKARIYIPSTQAYGPQSPSPDIPPNSSLIFDLEILKVSAQPPTTNNPAPPTIDTTRR
jgi:FKBP-type peptidyl-prolyl cis-trans isomerase FkpA